MKRLLKHAHFWLIVGLFGIDGLFFGLTDPDKVPSLLLIIGFLLCAFTLYCVVRGVLVVSSWYGLPFNRHGKRLARVLTGLAAGILALQSIGELGSRDVLVLLPLTILTYMYVTYGRRVQHE
jgi:uncharacterized membrane protein YccC